MRERDPLSIGRYRVTAVSIGGMTTSRLFRSKAKATTHFMGLVQLKHIRYALFVCFDNDDDPIILQTIEKFEHGKAA